MTTTVPAEGQVHLGRTLYDITQLLESADGAAERVRRVLELLHDLVPYDQCAMLEARLGHDPHVVLVPETPPDERARLTRTLLDIFGQLVGPNAPAPASAAVTRPQDVHLAVPFVGLDEVNGLLFVRRAEGEYSEDQLRVLSLVAAKLAAYFTMLRAREEVTELARELDEARRVAEAADRTKDEFLALVSSELKTPLGAMLACAHILRAPTAGDDARNRAADHLERSVHAQAKLVDDLLDLTCIASAALRLNLRVVEPAALIQTTIERLRRDAERKSIRLEADLDRAAMPLVLDPDRINQIVSTLVANAIDFTPAGGQVEVRLERAAGYARIQVRDGGGISGEDLAHVFDPFPRTIRAAGDVDRRPEGQPEAAEPGVGMRSGGERAVGLGVGLALVKDLVELHGGRVRAESAGPEQGTTFTVELPQLSRAHGRRDALDRRPAAVIADDRPLAGIRVLLVDHDLGLRESFESVLEDYGVEVTAVASAPEALAALERSMPDVLLFGDLAVRGESVYDLMRDVTVRACPLPVVSISAWRFEEKERERAAGFRLHLAKPLEVRTLVNTIADLAGRARGKTIPPLSALPDGDRAPRRLGD